MQDVQDGSGKIRRSLIVWFGLEHGRRRVSHERHDFRRCRLEKPGVPLQPLGSAGTDSGSRLPEAAEFLVAIQYVLEEVVAYR